MPTRAAPHAVSASSVLWDDRARSNGRFRAQGCGSPSRTDNTVARAAGNDALRSAGDGQPCTAVIAAAATATTTPGVAAAARKQPPAQQDSKAPTSGGSQWLGGKRHGRITAATPEEVSGGQLG